MKILDVSTVDPDPLKQFKQWFGEALTTGFPLPEAMTLATVSPEGLPSARMVLLKIVDERGFVFFTNYNSRKGKELSRNNHAALVFHWNTLERQIRIEGRVEVVSPKESDEYFHTRPRTSQIGALISPQSEIVSGREELDDAYKQAAEEFDGKVIPRPGYWGGYRVEPYRIEFWQGRTGRLHDRIEYRLLEDGVWLIRRLAP